MEIFTGIVCVAAIILAALAWFFYLKNKANKETADRLLATNKSLETSLARAAEAARAAQQASGEERQRLQDLLTSLLNQPIVQTFWNKIPQNIRERYAEFFGEAAG